MGTAEFFDGLPVTTYHTHDTTRHRLADMENHMQMIRHEAELENTHLRVVLIQMHKTINNTFTKRCALHSRLGGVIVRNNKRSQ